MRPIRALSEAPCDPARIAMVVMTPSSAPYTMSRR
jgi:hypothetical protein